MAADAPAGPKGQPRFLGTGAPATAADLGIVSDYAALVGNRRADTASVRTALPAAQMWDGLEFFETDTGRMYTRVGGAWVLSYARIMGRVVRSDNASGFDASGYANAAGNGNWTAETAIGITAYNGGWTIPVTARYFVSYDLRASGLFLAGFTVNYDGPAPSLLGMSTAPPVQNVAAAAGPLTPIRLNQGDVLRPYVLSHSGSLSLLKSSDIGGGGFFAVSWAGGA